jgi:hypothetical protein
VGASLLLALAPGPPHSGAAARLLARDLPDARRLLARALRGRPAAVAARLAGWRAEGMRGRWAAPLFDAPAAVRGLEAAYRLLAEAAAAPPPARAARAGVAAAAAAAAAAGAAGFHVVVARGGRQAAGTG